MVSKLNVIDNSKLSTSIKKKLKMHAKYHTMKHIKYMIQLLNKNKGFNYAHIKAMEVKGR